VMFPGTGEANAARMDAYNAKSTVKEIIARRVIDYRVVNVTERMVGVERAATQQSMKANVGELNSGGLRYRCAWYACLLCDF